MTIEERLSGKNSDEIANIIVEIEKELLIINEYFGLKRKEFHTIDLEMHDLEAKKKRLRIELDDSRMKKQRADIELEIVKQAFWRSKGK